MSNRNGNPAVVNAPAKEATEPVVEPTPAPVPEAKKGFFQRLGDGVRKMKMTIKSTKGGRAVITISKGAAIALGLYGSYKAGQRSVKPVTVYVDSGEAEAAEAEDPNDEAPVELEAEEANEPVAEQE